MKSGTATKMMLDVMFANAFNKKSQENDIKNSLKMYNNSFLRDSHVTSSLSQLMDVAGHTLKSGGSIIYVGMDSFGLVGLIDASECPPTFGAFPSDVRGYCCSRLHGNEDPIGCRSGGDQFKCWPMDYRASILPPSDATDLVIVIPQFTPKELASRGTLSSAPISSKDGNASEILENFAEQQRIHDGTYGCHVHGVMSESTTRKLEYQELIDCLLATRKVMTVPKMALLDIGGACSGKCNCPLSISNFDIVVSVPLPQPEIIPVCIVMMLIVVMCRVS